MDNTWKGVIYILGMMAAAYLSLEYVIPLLFKGLLVIVTVALWICIGILALYLVMYSIKLLGGR